jgi:hypothetical protein
MITDGVADSADVGFPLLIVNALKEVRSQKINNVRS